MPLKDLRDADEIVRVDPGDRSTPQRDACADWIQREIIDAGRWPLPATRMAELSAEHAADPDNDVQQGWSRQHISNVLDFYFEPKRDRTIEDDELTLHINVPNTVTEREDYLRGYLDGLRQDL